MQVSTHVFKCVQNHNIILMPCSQLCNHELQLLSVKKKENFKNCNRFWSNISNYRSRHFCNIESTWEFLKIFPKQCLKIFLKFPKILGKFLQNDFNNFTRCFHTLLKIFIVHGTAIDMIFRMYFIQRGFKYVNETFSIKNLVKASQKYISNFHNTLFQSLYFFPSSWDFLITFSLNDWSCANNQLRTKSFISSLSSSCMSLRSSSTGTNRFQQEGPKLRTSNATKHFPKNLSLRAFETSP